MPIRTSQKVALFQESVIREMTWLFLAGVNLAQGFPNFSAPEPMKPEPMQPEGAAFALGFLGEYYADLTEKYRARRNFTTSLLREVGFQVYEAARRVLHHDGCSGDHVRRLAALPGETT